MSARDDVVAGRPPLLRLPGRWAHIVPVVAVTWAIVAIVALFVATEFGLLSYRPGGDAYEIEQRQWFMIAFVVAIIASRWSVVVGGTIASASAAAVLIFARQQLEWPDATAVVVVFAVPGALWMLVYLHGLAPRAAVVSMLVMVLAVVGGAAAAAHFYDQVYGPSHPESTTPPFADVGVDWVWVGGTTSTGAVVVAELDDVAPRLALDTDGTFEGPRWITASSSVDRIARFELTDLTPSTTYHYGVEADASGGRTGRDVEAIGSFRTFPDGPASFRLAVGSCTRVGSNGSVFDEIRRLDPLLFIIDGDLHYSNIGDDDRGAFVDAYRTALSQPAPAALYRSTSMAYVWDDHDYGANNADATSESRPAALAAYRDAVPHYPLVGSESPIHQAFTIGRVRVIITDPRSARSPSAEQADATMLGTAQRAWLERELVEASRTSALILWVNPVPWISEATSGGDDWGGFAVERNEIADVIAEHEIGSLVMLSGDAHMVAIDDGTNSDYSTAEVGGFPVLHAAALDRPGHVKGGPYSEGVFPGGGQFGIVDIVDDGGDTITVTLSGRNYAGDVLVTHEVSVDADD